MKLKELLPPNELDRKAKKAVKLLGIYDKKNLNVGAKTGVSAQTVEVKASDTGTIVGRRTIYQK
jgi:hypothetical protein